MTTEILGRLARGNAGSGAFRNSLPAEFIHSMDLAYADHAICSDEQASSLLYSFIFRLMLFLLSVSPSFSHSVV
jgi:hypothetical protein